MCINSQFYWEEAKFVCFSQGVRWVWMNEKKTEKKEVL